MGGFEVDALEAPDAELGMIIDGAKFDKITK